MGRRNKLLLPFQGRALVVHTLAALQETTARPILVVTGHEAEQVETALSDFEVTFVHNPDYAEGMGTSLRVGIEAAPLNATGYLICLADLPLLNAQDLTLLIDAFQSAYAKDPDVIVVPQHQGRQGHPVLFSARYRVDLLALRGAQGGRRILQQNLEHILPVDMPNAHSFQDIDTPEGYEALRRTSTVHRTRPC